jgi:hypothetical protein
MRSRRIQAYRTLGHPEASRRRVTNAEIEAAEAQKDATVFLKRTARATVVLATATFALAVATIILVVITYATTVRH